MIAPQIIENAAAFAAGERMPTEVDISPVLTFGSVVTQVTSLP